MAKSKKSGGSKIKEQQSEASSKASKKIVDNTNGVDQGSKKKVTPKPTNSNVSQSPKRSQQQTKSQKQPKSKAKGSSSSCCGICLGLSGLFLLSIIVAGAAIYLSEDAQLTAGRVYKEHVEPVVLKTRQLVNKYMDQLQAASTEDAERTDGPNERLMEEKRLKEEKEKQLREKEEFERKEKERREKEERLRKEKEEAEKKAEKERKAAEAAQKAEQERKEKEKKEEARKKKEKEEAERKAEEERKEIERKEELKRKAELERKEKERKEEETKKKEKEEAERKAAEEKKQKDLKEEEDRKRKEKQEAEKKAAEEKKQKELKEEEDRKRKEKEDAERKAERERQEKERKAAEERKIKEKEEAEKKERDRKEAEEKKKKEEAEKKEKQEKKEEEERKKKEKAEEERKKNEEEERKKKEREEVERKAEQDRKEKEKKAEEQRKKKEEAERKEREKKVEEESKKKEVEAAKKAEQEMKEMEMKLEEEKKKVEKENSAKKAEQHKQEKAKVKTEQEKQAEGASAKQGQSKKEEPYEFASITNGEDMKIKDQLDKADILYDEDDYEGAVRIYDSILKSANLSPRAMYGKGLTLDKLGFKHRSNEYLEQAINFLERFILLPEVPDALFLMGGRKLAERQHFRGWGKKAVKTFTLMLERFPEDVKLRSELGVTYMMIGRNEQAREVFEQILEFEPNNGFAKVHIGFILKTSDNNLEKAIPYLREGIESGEEGTSDGRFYVQLGDALLRVDQEMEARRFFKDAETKGLFLSRWQRSLYNVKQLTGRHFWTAKQLGYEKHIELLEKNWKVIRDEGLAQLDKESGSFMPEEENLRDTGDWKQFTLYQQGRKNEDNCAKVPKTCAIIDQILPAKSCKRGQVKFSLMSPGIHVWPHTGPTNCRLRSHLGLVVPEGPVLRVVNETKTWQEGRVFTFDDSFEHEVWHKGTKLRLILIVDFWHPELTERQRRTLSPI